MKGLNKSSKVSFAGHTTLLDFVTQAGLAETLSGAGPFTIFAPTNEAFERLPAETAGALAQDPELLSKALLYHALSGAVTSDQISNDMVADTLAGGPVRANIYLRSNYYDVSRHGAPINQVHQPCVGCGDHQRSAGLQAGHHC